MTPCTVRSMKEYKKKSQDEIEKAIRDDEGRCLQEIWSGEDSHANRPCGLRNWGRWGFQPLSPWSLFAVTRYPGLCTLFPMLLKILSYIWLSRPLYSSAARVSKFLICSGLGAGTDEPLKDKKKKKRKCMSPCWLKVKVIPIPKYSYPISNLFEYPSKDKIICFFFNVYVFL